MLANHETLCSELMIGFTLSAQNYSQRFSVFYTDVLDKEYVYIALTLCTILVDELNWDGHVMPSGWLVSAEDTTSTLVRALSRVGGLICLAQADQFKAPF